MKCKYKANVDIIMLIYPQCNRTYSIWIKDIDCKGEKNPNKILNIHNYQNIHWNNAKDFSLREISIRSERERPLTTEKAVPEFPHIPQFHHHT